MDKLQQIVNGEREPETSMEELAAAIGQAVKNGRRPNLDDPESVKRETDQALRDYREGK